MWLYTSQNSLYFNEYRFPYLSYSQPSGASYIQPAFYSARNSCVANFAGGHLHFGNWRWMSVNCSQEFKNVTIICEQPWYNVSKEHRIFKFRDFMVKNDTVATTLQNQSLIVPNFFCKLGWLYIMGKCVNIRMTTSKHKAGDTDHCVIIRNKMDHNNLTFNMYVNEIDPSNIYYYIWNKLRRYLPVINVDICTSSPLYLNDTSGVYQCEDTNFILQHYVCDGHNDCQDKSDEEHCKHVCNLEDTFSCYRNCSRPECQCHDMYFQCARSGCVPMSRICDGIDDCEDASDESFCVHVSREITRNVHLKPPSLFTCKSGLEIESSLLNDTIPDCPDFGDDESLSSVYNELDIRNNRSIMIQCNPDHPKRFPLHMICVLIWEKAGMISGCRNGAHLTNCRNHSCPDQFKCQHTYCIPIHMICDGIKDCPDGKDEQNCQHTIYNNLLKCRGSQESYIHLKKMNDGVVDCPDNHYDDDEAMNGIKHCPHECKCIGFAVICSSPLKTFTRVSFAKSLIVSGITDPVNVDFKPFTNLLHLDISNNAIKQFSSRVFYPLITLTNFSLANISLNDIPTDMLVKMKHLHKLDLRHNNISLIPFNSFGGLSYLQDLVLSNNYLYKIMVCGFIGLYDLLYLNLSHNSLSIIDHGSICGVDNLKILDISHNHIYTVVNNVFNAINLQQLTSSVNGLCCYVKSRVACQPIFVDDFSSCDNILNNIGIRIIVWIIATFSMLENLAVFAVFQFMLSKKSSMRKYIHKLLNKQLIVSDCIMGLYFLALSVYDIMFTGNFIAILENWKKSWHCKGLAFLSLLSFEMSLCMSLVLSVERVFAVCFPFKQMLRNINKARLLAVGCWLISALVAAAPVIMLYLKSRDFNNNLCIMLISFDQLPMWMILLLFIINTLVPLINVGLNSVIIKILHRNHELKKDMIRNKKQRKERGITSRIVLLVLVNSGCWIAVIILALLKEFGVLTDMKLFANIGMVCLPVSSLINPILNCFTSQEFIKMFHKK